MVSKSFIKSTPHAAEEARGLEALASIGVIRTPRVLKVSDHEIELERIESSYPASEFWRAFGTALARHHQVHFDEFGFDIDNHIGATPQRNPKRKGSWADYFLEFRLKALLAHSALSEARDEFERCEGTIRETLEEVKEPASLLHGDLWNGNFLCDRSGQPVWFDPAPYRGHREADLAMTELFGGFAPEFYEAYRTEYPLTPGYERRREVYNLYHLFNHWILFGGGYRAQSLASLKRIG